MSGSLYTRPPWDFSVARVSCSVKKAGTLGGKVRQLPLPGLALTCLIAPTLYAVGMLLYLLGDKWKPGMGVGSLGTILLVEGPRVSSLLGLPCSVLHYHWNAA